MELRKLGKTEMAISPIIMGTWQAGKQYWVGIEDSEIIKAIQKAFELGINTFDTAEAYGYGYSEKILAKALKGKREHVILMSKVFPNHLAHHQVIEACDQTLKHLNTDYLDLYQIHWPSGSWGSSKVPMEETMKAMNELKDQGKIRAIGVSNFYRSQIEEALEYGAIESLQPPYSLFWRYIEKDIVSFCRDKNISILAYSSLAQGFLTGKFKKNHCFDKGDHRKNNKLFRQDHFPKVLEAVEKLEAIAKRKRVSLAELALAWVIHQKNTFAIVGARNSEQIAENAKASDVVLTEEEVVEMDRISQPVYKPFLDDLVHWSFKR